MNQPLAEIFGFPVTNETERAKRYRQNKLCPYNNIVSNCTKNSIEFPLGVCSLYHKQKPVIICPIRFREDWTIISDAAEFIFGKKENWTHVGEVRLNDKTGKSAGNIDYVLVSYDDKGRVIDFGSLEVQAVYISGNLTGPFTAYLENPSPKFTWNNALKISQARLFVFFEKKAGASDYRQRFYLETVEQKAGCRFTNQIF